MIDTTLKWIEEQVTKHHIKGLTLDVGSRDINGNPRDLFEDYIGIDAIPGNNVDRVLDVYNLLDHYEQNTFDNVLCLNVLEHVPNIYLALDSIYGVLRSGGYFFVSVPGIGFPKHDYPKDYWRFTEEAVREVIMDGFKVIDLKSYLTEHNRFSMIDCLGVKR